MRQSSASRISLDREAIGIWYLAVSVSMVLSPRVREGPWAPLPALCGLLGRWVAVLSLEITITHELKAVEVGVERDRCLRAIEGEGRFGQDGVWVAGWELSPASDGLHRVT